MSGILDNKTRVLDTIVTQEGRRQLANGGIDVSYVTFSDSQTFYTGSESAGPVDAASRLYLEACSLPQDSVSFLADGDGNVQPFNNFVGVNLSNGRIIDYSYSAQSVSGSVSYYGAPLTITLKKGDEFSQSADELLASSAENFRKLYPTATIDSIFDIDGFGMGPDKVTFTMTPTRPIGAPAWYASHISALDSVFSDPKLVNLPNFRYLPPCNRIDDSSVDKTDYLSTKKHQLGTYEPLGQPLSVNARSYSAVKNVLDAYESMGCSVSVAIDPTSYENNLVGQFFEKGFSNLTKLDVIDFGELVTGDVSVPLKHIFFVGKVKVDENGTDTFLHMFTIVFE